VTGATKPQADRAFRFAAAPTGAAFFSPAPASAYERPSAGNVFEGSEYATVPFRFLAVADPTGE
jgi:hypothetical protein